MNLIRHLDHFKDAKSTVAWKTTPNIGSKIITHKFKQKK